MRQLVGQRWYLLLLALPFIVMTFLFNYIPLFGWVYAFFDYKPGIPLSQTGFVGLKYFVMSFTEWNQLKNVMINTLVMSFLGLALTPLPVLFAVFLQEIRWGFFKKFVQTFTTLPNFISWIIVFGIFFSIFSVEGLFNELMLKWGWLDAPTNVLGNAAIAWYVQTLLSLWKSLGWGAIIYLAAIAGIDAHLYEAARVDGAGRWRCMWHITLPGLAPTYLVLLILQISMFLSNGFDQYFVFYNPLVASKLEVLDYFVYKVGILGRSYSYSVALGIWKTAISITLLFFANAVARKIRGNSIV